MDSCSYFVLIIKIFFFVVALSDRRNTYNYSYFLPHPKLVLK